MRYPNVLVQLALQGLINNIGTGARENSVRSNGNIFIILIIQYICFFFPYFVIKRTCIFGFQPLLYTMIMI